MTIRSAWRAPSRDLIALLVSIVALGLSAASFIAAGRPADVKLVLVEQVRLTTDPGAAVYLQPSFVSTAANDRAEVIDDIEATLRHADDPVVPLRWAQTGTFDVGPFPDYAVTWRITGLGPEPVVVTPSVPQTPILQFDTGDGFAWAAGTYTVELRASRLVAGEPLVGRLTFTLSDADVERLRAEGPDRFVSYPAIAGD